MNEIFEVEGQVIEYSKPVSIPGKQYTICFITIKFEVERVSKGKPTFGYYTIKSYKKNENRRVTMGVMLKCWVRRESNIWIKDKYIQNKKAFDFIDGEKIEVGVKPVIFDEYILESELCLRLPTGINVQNNDDDDLPF